MEENNLPSFEELKESNRKAKAIASHELDIVANHRDIFNDEMDIDAYDKVDEILEQAGFSK